MAVCAVHFVVADRLAALSTKPRCGDAIVGHGRNAAGHAASCCAVEAQSGRALASRVTALVYFVDAGGQRSFYLAHHHHRHN